MQSNKEITLVGDSFAIKFNYKDWLVMAIKNWPTRPKPGWSKLNRAWIIKASPIEVEALILFGDKYGFTWSKEATELSNKILATADRRRKLSESTSPIRPEFKPQVNTPPPYPFQVAGVEYILDSKKCLLADDMGTGKTRQALMAIDSAGAYPAIVTCPAMLKLNWLREVHRWLPNNSVQILEGRKTPVGKTDITIVNYDLLSPEPEKRELLDKLKLLKARSLLVDESHYCKSFKAQRTKAVYELSREPEYTILMSGTPATNKPIDLEPQLKILDLLDEFGGSFEFRQRYAGAYQDRFGWHYDLGRLGKEHAKKVMTELHHRLRAVGMIRRTKAQVLPQLPEKSQIIMPIQPDLKTYEDVLYGIVPTELVQRLNWLEKLREAAALAKVGQIVDWTKAQLEDTDVNKLVIFAYHVSVQKALAEQFQNPATIFGVDTQGTRMANVDRFQSDDDCKVMIASLTAAKEGINLTAANNCIFAQTGWVPYIQAQAEDRLHRIGQKNAVNAYYFIATDTIEEKIWQRLMIKKDLLNTIADGERQIRLEILDEVLKSVKPRIVT